MSIHLLPYLPPTPTWLWNSAWEEREGGRRSSTRQVAVRYPTSSRALSDFDRLNLNRPRPFSCLGETISLHRSEWKLHEDDRPGEQPRKINPHAGRRVFEAPWSKLLMTTTTTIALKRLLTDLLFPTPRAKNQRGFRALKSRSYLLPEGA